MKDKKLTPSTDVALPKVSRRTFLQSSSALTASAIAAGFSLPLIGCGSNGSGKSATSSSSSSTNNSSTTTPSTPVTPAVVTYVAPKEGATHAATWMAYGATFSAWGTSGDLGSSRVLCREDLMRIAAQLSRFEPVKMLCSNNNDNATYTGGGTDKVDAQNKLNTIIAGTGNKNTLVTYTDPTNPFDNSGKIVWSAPKNSSSTPLPAYNANNVSLIEKTDTTWGVNDLWTRDSAPVFVKGSDNKRYGVNFNFNGWGLDTTFNGAAAHVAKAANYTKGAHNSVGKFTNSSPVGTIPVQDVDGDKTITSFILSQLGTTAGTVNTPVVMEGGGIEYSGGDLAIVAESCIFIGNRNPELCDGTGLKATTEGKAKFEAEMLRVLGVKKIIYIPGIPKTEITDGHVDFYARFTHNNRIVYTWDGGINTGTQPTIMSSESDWADANKQTTALNTSGYLTTDGKNRIELERFKTANSSYGITLISLPTPTTATIKASIQNRSTGTNPGGTAQTDVTTRNTFETTFAAGYVGYYEANNCIIMGQFGDAATDFAAFKILRDEYPDRHIISITTDGIGNGGGTIHCATQQEIPQ